MRRGGLRLAVEYHEGQLGAVPGDLVECCEVIGERRGAGAVAAAQEARLADAQLAGPGGVDVDVGLDGVGTGVEGRPDGGDRVRVVSKEVERSNQGGQVSLEFAD